MTTDLETELRASLRERAADVPDPAVRRLTRAEYRPRTHRLQPRIAVGGGVLTAGATTAVVLSLTGGASTAFAGWSASPTKATAAQVSAAERTCREQVPIKGLPLALSDARGPFTDLIFATNTEMSDCLIGPAGIIHSSALMSDGPIAPPADQVILNPSHSFTSDGQTSSGASDAVGAGVTGVTLNLDDGAHVTATVESGWFAGWWPGTATLVSADVRTASGTHTQIVHHKVCRGVCGGTVTTDGQGTPAPGAVTGPQGG